MLLVLKSILFLFFFLTTIFSFGKIICIITKEDHSIIKIFIYGLAGYLSFFQLIYSIFFNLKLSTHLFTILFFVFSILVMGIALYLMIISKKYIEFKKIFQNNVTKLQLLVFILILIQISATIFLQHRDDDDAFYITIATSFKNMSNFGETSTLMGVPNLLYFKENTPVIRQGWEIFFGTYGEIFSLHPTMIMHLLIPPIFVIFHYFCVYLIGTQLFSSSKKIYVFLLGMTLYNFFGFFSVYSQTSFLFFRLWQGKSILVNILLPAMFYLYLKIWKNNSIKFSWNDLFLFFIFSYGGRSLSVIGVYFIPLSLFAYIIIYAIRAKNIIPLLQSAICISFNILAAVFSFFDVTAGNIDMNPPEYLDIFKMYSGNSSIFTIFFICIALIILFKIKQLDMLFVWYPITVFLTVLNPFLYKWIAIWLTGASVYWRMIWLLPVQFCIVSTIVNFLLLETNTKRKLGASIFFLFALLSGGKFGFTPENFSFNKNIYKLDSDVLIVSNYLLEDIYEKDVILAPMEIAPQIRQYSSDLIVLAPRYESYLKDDLSEIYKFTYQNNEITPMLLEETLQKNNINFIILRKDQFQEIKIYSQFCETYELRNYVIMKR